MIYLPTFFQFYLDVSLLAICFLFNGGIKEEKIPFSFLADDLSQSGFFIYLCILLFFQSNSITSLSYTPNMLLDSSLVVYTLATLMLQVPDVIFGGYASYFNVIH